MAEFPGTIPSAVLGGGSASMSLPLTLEARELLSFQEEDAQLTLEHPIVQMVGAAYRSTLPTYADGDAACLHVTSDGRLMVDTEFTLDGNVVIDNISVFATNIADSSTVGPALIDAAGHVQVDILSMPGSITGYAEDTQHITGDIGFISLAVRNDTLAALCDADGDYAPFQVDAQGALFAQVVTSAGNALNVQAGNVATGTLRITLADNDPAVASLIALDGTEGSVEKVSFDASVQSGALSSGALYRLTATEDCYYVWGANPTATSSDNYLSAGIDRTVRAGGAKIAAIKKDVAGDLHVVPLT